MITRKELAPGVFVNQGDVDCGVPDCIRERKHVSEESAKDCRSYNRTWKMILTPNGLQSIKRVGGEAKEERIQATFQVKEAQATGDKAVMKMGRRQLRLALQEMGFKKARNLGKDQMREILLGASARRVQELQELALKGRDAVKEITTKEESNGSGNQDKANVEAGA